MELAVATGRGHDVLACCWHVNTAGVLQGLMKDNTRQDRYWNQMQRLGGTLSHLLKEVLARFCCESSTCLSAAAGPTEWLPLQCCLGAFVKQVVGFATTGATVRPRHLASWDPAGQAAANTEDRSLEVLSPHECVPMSSFTATILHGQQCFLCMICCKRATAR
jgi:hypothetical protein